MGSGGKKNPCIHQIDKQRKCGVHTRWTITQLWKATPVLLPGECHRQSSLVGFHPWGSKESDATEWLTHFKKEGHSGTCSSVDEPWGREATWNKPVTESQAAWMKRLEWSQPQAARGTVVPGGWGAAVWWRPSFSHTRRGELWGWMVAMPTQQLSMCWILLSHALKDG